VTHDATAVGAKFLIQSQKEDRQATFMVIFYSQAKIGHNQPV